MGLLYDEQWIPAWIIIAFSIGMICGIIIMGLGG